MARTLGYLLTWTTYGSWLQGDERGYVQEGQILKGNSTIYQICQQLQKYPAVKLTQEEKRIVHQTILKEAQRVGQTVEAIAVCTNHVHLLLRYSPHPVGRIISRYKNLSTFALRELGRKGRIWTRGFDTRFCYSQSKVDYYIMYVNKHND
jgi:REP element-mobilizing transposase RayT